MPANTIFTLTFVYNGIQKKLYIYEKGNLNNKVVINVDEAIKQVKGKWRIVFKFSNQNRYVELV